MPALQRPAAGQQGDPFGVAARLDDSLGIGEAYLDPETHPAIAPLYPEVRLVGGTEPLGEGQVVLVEDGRGQQPGHQALLGLRRVLGHGGLEGLVAAAIDVGQLDGGLVDCGWKGHGDGFRAGWLRSCGTRRKR